MNSATKRAEKRSRTSLIVLRRLRQPERWDRSRESMGIYPPRKWIYCYRGFLTNHMSAEWRSIFNDWTVASENMQRCFRDICTAVLYLKGKRRQNTLFTLWNYCLGGSYALSWNKLLWRELGLLLWISYSLHTWILYPPLYSGSSLLPDLPQEQNKNLRHILHLKSFTPFSTLAFGCTKDVEVCLYTEGFFLPSPVSI